MLRKKLKSIPFLRKVYGLYRFTVFPLRVLKAKIEDAFIGNTPGDIEYPPPKLRFRVHGSLGRSGFLDIGENVAKDILQLLKKTGYEMYSFNRILDFGCGCARVLRNFRNHPQGCEFYGTDIDSELIAWCKTQPGLGEFDINPHMPPMKYPDNHFDFIYSISVFTHLDEEMQLAWLLELRRITKPGGVLLLSIHGPSSQDHLDPNQKKELSEKGFVYFKGETGMLKLDGLPDFYHSAYHSARYIQEVWGKYFNVLGHFEKGINFHQDAIMLKKMQD